jgi:hypothetical protein
MRLFVYGSLMDRTEVGRALGVAYAGPMDPHVLPGYFRTWTGWEEDFVYLNLEPAAGRSTAGVLLDLNDTQLRALDVNEPTYARVKIGDVEAYIAKPEFRGRGSVVRGSYLRLVRAALKDEPFPELPGHLTVADEA